MHNYADFADTYAALLAERDALEEKNAALRAGLQNLTDVAARIWRVVPPGDDLTAFIRSIAAARALLRTEAGR